MNILNLQTIDIVKLLTRKSNLIKLTQQTLVVDTTFNISVGIYHPDIKYFNCFNNFNTFNEISIFDITKITSNNFLLKEWEFIDTRFLRTVSENTYKLDSLLEAINLKKKSFSTLALSPKAFFETPELKNIFNFKVSNCFSIFPPQTTPYLINNMAIVYDPNLPSAYKESFQLFETIGKYFSKISVTLRALPLKKEDFEEILKTYSIVHFSGHADKKGILINSKEHYRPTSFTGALPKVLFLNTCLLFENVLDSFIKRDPSFFVYSIENQLDSLVNIDLIINFYLALFLGYRFNQVASIFNNKNLRFHGWAHQQIQGQF